MEPYGYIKIDSRAPLRDMSLVHAGRAFIQKIVTECEEIQGFDKAGHLVYY